MHSLNSTNSIILILIFSLEIHTYYAFTLPIIYLKQSWFHKKSNLVPMMAGMGMASKSRKKKGGSKKQKNASSSFDVSKSLLKNEKLYEKITDAASKELSSSDDDYINPVSEYVIAARGAPMNGSTVSAAISDWIPVAQLCVKRPVSGSETQSSRDAEIVQMAISHFRREISYAAAQAAPIFNTIPRNIIQYSVEPIDSFYKFVYDDIIEGGKAKDDNNGMTMTKADARKVLDLAQDCNDPQEIKKAYRSLIFSLHPDRFVDIDRSDEEVQNASEKFSKVSLAYETLSSGVRNGNDGKSFSWYESLGGRSRTEFSGAIEMIPSGETKDGIIEGHTCAVAGLTSELVMTFVARNQAFT